VAVAVEVGDDGDGVEPLHEMNVNDNAVAAATKRALQGMDFASHEF
jgi:hypothetical protein